MVSDATDFGHIAERFVLHFFCSAAVLLMAWFGLRAAARWFPALTLWLPTDIRPLLLVCALLVAALLPLREPWDVFKGNNGAGVWNIVKAYTDVLSWWLGAGFSAWTLYRFMDWRG